MKKILSLCVLLSLFACGISYDGETRLVLETKLIDSQGNPIPGKPVSVYYSTGMFSDNISNGTTDGNGQSQLIFPAPEADSTKISIGFYDNDGTYQEKSFENILKSDFGQYKFTLSNIVLYKHDEITSLLLTLNPVSANTAITSIRIPGNPAGETVNWHPELNLYPEMETSFAVLKNHSIDLVYTITDYNSFPNTQTEHTVPLTIGNNAANYTINY